MGCPGPVESPVGRNWLLAPLALLGFPSLAVNAVQPHRRPSGRSAVLTDRCCQSAGSPGARDLFSLHLCRVGSYLPLPAKICFLGPAPRGVMLGHYCVNCWAVKEPFLTHPRLRVCGHRAPQALPSGPSAAAAAQEGSARAEGTPGSYLWVRALHSSRLF